MKNNDEKKIVIERARVFSSVQILKKFKSNEKTEKFKSNQSKYLNDLKSLFNSNVYDDVYNNIHFFELTSLFHVNNLFFKKINNWRVIWI